MNTRQRKICDLLLRRQEVTVQELVDAFQVSAMTVRRDLEYLEQQRALTRTRGGAMSSKPSIIEFSFHERQRDRLAEKSAIGRQVAAQITPGMTLVLDTGTTTLEVARALVGIPRLRVITSSLAIAAALYAYEHIELVLLGGCVRHNSPDLSGSLTEDNLNYLHADAAILGADAVDPRGLYSSDMQVARVSQAMITNSLETWLVVDSSKFARRSFIRFAGWGAIHHLVTDEGISPADYEWGAESVGDVQVVG
ncbi:MAG: DeoR/GlpR family DNA-binding transcription regulator [Armatimonadota bacterium]